MDKIWDRKSFEVGVHWPLWWGWKTEWPRRTDKSRTLKVFKKNLYSCEYLQMIKKFDVHTPLLCFIYLKCWECLLYQVRLYRRMLTWLWDCWSDALSVWVQHWEVKVAVCWRQWKMESRCLNRLLQPEMGPPVCSSLPWMMMMTLMANIYSRGIFYFFLATDFLATNDTLSLWILVVCCRILTKKQNCNWIITLILTDMFCFYSHILLFVIRSFFLKLVHSSKRLKLDKTILIKHFQKSVKEIR